MQLTKNVWKKRRIHDVPMLMTCDHDKPLNLYTYKMVSIEQNNLINHVKHLKITTYIPFKLFKPSFVMFIFDLH